MSGPLGSVVVGADPDDLLPLCRSVANAVARNFGAKAAVDVTLSAGDGPALAGAAADVSVGGAPAEILRGRLMSAHPVYGSSDVFEVSVPVASNLRLGHKNRRSDYAADDILDAARQFLGMRYLWGGTSTWGLDCSGLVHLAYRAHGVLVPRDTFDQPMHLQPVAVNDVQPGDLYFFARPDERVHHVGFATRSCRPGRLPLDAARAGER